ncbi:SCO2524 family protein [Phytomonospora sp. NPDC050363]|uniref:SCO2524 family protein n=1 Tax=Phytomonospora sp. NPDC050363 TaxID=3155642 RepID=UPI003404490D
MKIQPRRNVLDLWKAVIGVSYQDGKWKWDGEPGLDSVSEAQQLLCIMGPAVDLSMLRLERPNETDAGVRAALRPLGSAGEIPVVLTGILTDYLVRHSDGDGNPTFAGGSYFVPFKDPSALVKDEQESLEVTESYALSVTLTLAMLGFVKTFRAEVKNNQTKARLDKLEDLASRRLTGAMIGLLRSFSVFAFDVDDPEGIVRIDTLRQRDNASSSAIAKRLRKSMEPIVAGLGDLKIGSGRNADLEAAGRLFECGWSWGVVKDAPTIDGVEQSGPQAPGLAHNAPYLYFTTVALDGVADLFSSRTRILGLLNDDQARLANALQLRWDVTQRYWATLATFGEQSWLLEDPPWRTTDGVGSDYFSLMVSAISTRDMASRRAADSELSRLGGVLSELAKRSRITRRPDDTAHPAIAMHHPGFRAELDGSDLAGGPVLSWTNADFSAVLLKRTIGIATYLRDVEQRASVLDLVDSLWDHLTDRRFETGPAEGLWDAPENVFPVEVSREPGYSSPSWQQTVRVAESLVAAARLLDEDPPFDEEIARRARSALSEAEHIYDQELLRPSGESLAATLDLIKAKLAHARRILDTRPSTALAHAQTTLLELDQLVAARDDAKQQR